MTCGRGVREGLAGGAIGGVISGAPSTLHALATGGGVLSASRAAGALLGRPTSARGLAAHAVISLGWGGVLGVVLPRRHTLLAGAAAGLAIAAFDLGVVGRRIPEIAALPAVPQVLDHVAFGVVVAATLTVLERDRRSRAAASSPVGHPVGGAAGGLGRGVAVVGAG